MELRRVPELWRSLDVTVRDLPLGILLAVLSFLPVLRGQETQIGNLPARGTRTSAGAGRCCAGSSPR